LIEYAGHAREYVQTIELADWYGIVLASGDGLIYEVKNFRFLTEINFCL
jgi:diacylglycerol kinase family enzyme